MKTNSIKIILFIFIIFALSFVSSMTEARTLKLSSPRMTGGDVVDLQTYLNTNGYNVGIPDGVFGTGTRAAVMLFQKAKGLVQDGAVGPKTITLMSQLSGSTSTTTTSTTPGCSQGALFNTLTGQSCTSTTTTTSSRPGCLPGGLFSTLTGESCTSQSSSSSTPGCNAGALFSTINGQKCSSSTSPSTTVSRSGGGGGGGGSSSSSPTCSGSTSQSCTISNGVGAQTRTCNSGVWSSFGVCNVTSCNNGHVQSGNSCIVSSCSGSSTQSCTITNGTGSQSRTCANGTWSGFGACTVASCDNGYTQSGNSCVAVVVPDTTAPTVTAFNIPTTATSLTVSITTFVATDAVGITGYLLTETSSTPSAGSGSWTSSAPSSYVFSSQGSKTLYAWAKDLAGNVSASSSDTTTITIAVVTGTTYYVSNTGSDSNNGTSEGTPWATISKVNATTLSAGDQVLFKRGDTWRDSIEVDQSGTVSGYITYGAYGTGAKPRILGSTSLSSWTATGTPNVWRSNTTLSDPWTVITASGTNSQVFFIENNSDVTWGYHRTYDASFTNLTTNYDWTWNANNLYIYSSSNPNTQYAAVEAPQRQYAAQINHVEYIAFDNIEMAYLGGYGIRDAYGPQTLSGLNVTNMHIHHIGRKGSNVAYGTYNYHSDAYYAYNDIHDCGRRSISVALVTFSPSAIAQNIIIENNYLHNGFHTTGVDLTPSGGSTAPHTITNVIIRNNIIEDDPTMFLRGGDRSDILYSDGLNSNPMFIANQNANGDGAMSNVKIYNNVFIYSAGKAITLENTNDVEISYNTFYAVNPTIGNDQGFVYVSEGNGTPTNTIVKNNIFYNDKVYNANAGFPSLKADINWVAEVYSNNNLFYTTDSNVTTILIRGRSIDGVWMEGGDYTISQWASYVSDTGWDTNSPTPANPLFVNASIKNFHLQSGSPAKNTGTPIAGITTDIEGNPRSSTNPSIGAYE